MNKSILVVILALVACSNASAQVDSGLDGIGIYADLEGTINNVDAAVGTELFLYILATNVTAENGIQIWQLGVTTTSPDLLVLPSVLPFEYPYPASEWCGGPGPDRKINVMEGPLPQESIIHLATMKVLVIGEGPADLFLDRSSCGHPEHPPTYTTTNDDGTGRMVDLTPSSGSVESPVFRINGPGPVAAENAKWGSVKSLFR